ncbi:unnamed protein product [marine sediment metagenome]|uniref:Core-binding (CB) domain-containing protein n=1 Tax=marine sediment metagenome TaxID=412755 RepID=X1LG07_9ZZZZ
MNKYIDIFIFYLKNEKNYSNNTIVAYKNDLTQFFNYLKDYKLLKKTNVKYINHKIMRKYIVYLKIKKEDFIINVVILIAIIRNFQEILNKK